MCLVVSTVYGNHESLKNCLAGYILFMGEGFGAGGTS